MLELIDLRRNYGDVVALDGLSFNVEKGQMLGFVGPNGAGKTTAMRIVLGLLDPDGGTVKWNGVVVSEDVRRRFGYMPEERGLYPKMKVRDHLVYLAQLSGIDGNESRTERTAGSMSWDWRIGPVTGSRVSLSVISNGFSSPAR